MPTRFAIYYAPSASDPLWERAAVWLGRDAATGELIDGAVAGIDRPRLLNLTQSAGRYGFHATLKPPMALADGYSPEQLRDRMRAFADETPSVPLGRLVLARLGGFLALVPETSSEDLQFLAGQVVEQFEDFRRPPSLREMADRAAGGLTERQSELLAAYGYPYVFDQFQFHMTLTDRLAEADMDEIEEAARTWFGPLLDTPLVLDRLSLFVEPDTGKLFRRHDDFGLRP
ncbi:MAG: DUF1045 domain-containing protein [Devosia sp.]|uniref:DUF1045 domain-containing protein n=1 Tax=Devosia sp. TaxID=1871048 RepID=UPI0024CDE237|nr:DUF1045 domain-containing protein [Devosia sp.]UYN99068.1 MAG: DUF1045 domain-containing protein [Devosia sp.]